MNSDRLGAVLAATVIGAFVAGLAVVPIVLPSPPGGPTPPGARIAYYAVFASFVMALALIPLGVWVVERSASKRPALALRVATAVGVTLAMLALGWGVRTWAYPPHNLRQCFTDYRGNGHNGMWGTSARAAC